LPELVPFLEAHGENLFRLLYRVTLREDVAEDLMQDLFLRLRQSRGFRSTRSPIAYARRAALNLAFDWRRKQPNVSSVADIDHEPSDGQPSPLATLEHREQFQRVLDAMAWLSAANRQLLTLHYIQQESYESLAREYSRTPHQIRARCHKALDQLRAILTVASQRTDAERKP